MSNVKYWILAFIFSGMSSLISAESSEDKAKVEEIEQNVQRAHSNSSFKDKKRSEKMRHLQLKDFAGAWVFTADSLGGVFNNTDPNARGQSTTLDAQVTFDKKGNGIANFGSSITYAGIPGQEVIQDNTGITFKINITRPDIGVGKMTVTNPGQTPFEVDFVAVRSQTNGKVLKFEGHKVSKAASSDARIVEFNFQRQFQ